jgi:Family of unknown function (DUF6194)
MSSAARSIFDLILKEDVLGRSRDHSLHRRGSKLDRPGIFRLNIGVSKDTYAKLFPADGGDHDRAALDRLMPHPVYGPNHWVCVINPSKSTFESIKTLLEEAHGIAMGRVERRKIRKDGRA